MRFPEKVDVATTLAIAGIVVLLILAIVGTVANEEQWQEYKVQHNCREAGYIEGTSSTVTTINPGNGQVGVGTVTSPRQTRWLCDNDVEIYR